MQVSILNVAPKLLIGHSRIMSFANDQTLALWQGFGPVVKNIQHRADSNRISMTIYPASHPFTNPDPHMDFEKWAAVEVSSLHNQPPGMQTHKLDGGLYAMFIHKGPASAFPQLLDYIFGTWFPASGYAPDQREYFEVMGPNYHPADAAATEEIYIPIRRAR
jgi:AraC family transcriptional regulator